MFKVEVSTTVLTFAICFFQTYHKANQPVVELKLHRSKDLPATSPELACLNTFFFPRQVT